MYLQTPRTYELVGTSWECCCMDRCAAPGSLVLWNVRQLCGCAADQEPDAGGRRLSSDCIASILQGLLMVGRLGLTLGSVHRSA